MPVRESLDGKLLSRGLLHLLYDKLEAIYRQEWHQAVALNVLDLGGYGNVCLSLAERYRSNSVLVATDKRYESMSKWMKLERFSLDDAVPAMNRRRSYKDYRRRGFDNLLSAGEAFVNNHSRFNVVFINYDYGAMKPERAFWFARRLVKRKYGDVPDGFIILACNMQWLNTRGRWFRIFSHPDTCPEYVINAPENWQFTSHPAFYVWRAMGENANPKLDFILRHVVTPIDKELVLDSDVRNEFFDTKPNPNHWKGWDYVINGRVK